uniref:Uncharacterized protein n=1 Tax=Triticum urartu TaxID=4572 RepID=A0A8R7QQZ4_TRIUA
MLLPVHNRPPWAMAELPASLRPPSSCARAGSPTSAAPRASSAPGRGRRVVAVLPAARLTMCDSTVEKMEIELLTKVGGVMFGHYVTQK